MFNMSCLLCLSLCWCNTHFQNILFYFFLLKSFLYQDIKPANLLIANDGSLKIADLGLARIYDKNDPNRLYSHQVATRWYRAPELLYGSRNYTLAVDMWAVGCVMAEMINKSPLFPVSCSIYRQIDVQGILLHLTYMVISISKHTKKTIIISFFY